MELNRRTARIAQGSMLSLLVHGLLLGAMTTVFTGATLHLGVRPVPATVLQFDADWANQPEKDSQDATSDVFPVSVRPDEVRLEERRFLVVPSQLPSREITRPFSTPPFPRSDGTPAVAMNSNPHPIRRSSVNSPLLRHRGYLVEASEPLAETTSPRFDNNRPPEYPAVAIQQGWQGTVVLRVEVDPNGEVVDVEIVESSGHLVLDGAAVQAVQSWQASPAMRYGVQVSTYIRIPIRFEL